MATTIIKFQVLDVGQGTGNFIEIYDGGTLTHTVLIDLGSERAKEEAGGPSVEYVVAKLKEMTQPTVDALLLSHSDSDHINLVPQLLDAFYPVGTAGKKKKDTLQVSYARYGGAYQRYSKRSATNLLARLEKYVPGTDEPEPMGAGFTSFAKGKKSTPLITVGGVKLYVWIANATETSALVPDTFRAGKRRAADPFAINTNSLVVVAEFGGVQFVATGDATGVTLSEANTYATKEIRETFLDTVFMCTLPHHGSFATTFNLQGAGDDADEKEELPRENLDKFAGNVNAETITGSAERVKRFKHPSAVVMSFFWGYLDFHLFYRDPLLDDDNHFYIAWFFPSDGFERDSAGSGMVEEWPLFEWWYAVQTNDNIFTNFYYEWGLQGGIVLPPDPGNETPWLAQKPPQPPEGVAWSFEVEADGTRRVRRMVNRETTLALRRMILAGAPPEALEAPDLRLAGVAEAAGPHKLASDPRVPVGTPGARPPRAALPSASPAPTPAPSAPRPPAPAGLKVIP